MRLRSLDIDGFGHFERRSSGELPSGLVVLYCPAEERKDALLGFVRGLLFGMSNGRWPLRGAAAGRGALAIDGPDGTYSLRRLDDEAAPVLWHPNGRAASAAELARLLPQVANGSTRLYFDVALAQLRGYVAPSRPGSADDPWRLSLDRQRAAAVLRRFRGEREALLGAPGSEIEAIFAELERAEEELRLARRQHDQYPDLLRREAELRNEVGRLCGELAEQRRARERFQLVEELWPLWSQCWDAQRSLDVLEPIDEFPDEAINLLDASRQLAESQRELQRLERDRERARRALASLAAGDDRHEILADIDALYSEAPAYRSKLTAFARARARRDELSRSLPESARRVGGSGGESAFDPARLDLEEARAWHARAQQLAERESATRAALETTRATLRQLRDEQEKAVREGDPTSHTMNPLDRRWLSLWRLRRNLDELWAVQSQGEAKARLAEEHEAAVRAHTRPHWRVPPRWLRLFLWVFVAGAFAAALLAVTSDNRPRTMLFGGLALAGMLADLFLAGRSRIAAVRNQAAEAEENRLLWDLEQTRQSRDERWRRAGDIAGAIQVEAAQLGLPEIPDEVEIDDLEERLRRESAARAEVGVLAHLALALRAKLDEEAMLAAQLAEVREARAHGAGDWSAWKVGAGLPDDLAEENLTTYLCEFDRWRELRREAEMADVQLRDLGPAIEAWETRARATLAAVGAASADSLCGRDLVDQLSMLRESALRSDQRRRRSEQLASDIASLGAEIDGCRQRIAAAEAAVAELARAAGTDDHAEFERRRRVFDRRRALRGEIAAHEVRLAERLAHLPADEHEVVRDLLAGGDRAHWQAAVRQADEARETAEAALERVSRQQIAAAAACRVLEESPAVAVAAQRCAALRGELAECAGEWRRLAVAEGLIESTLGDHGSVREESLLAAASRLVEAGSDGSYTRIVRDRGDGVLRLVDRSGRAHDVPGAVDREVAEQAYLSLHLAAARDLARRDGAPPLLLDDVLRDLDDRQGARMAEEIARFAAEHQVLYFTAHRPTVERLRAADARVVEI